MLTEQRDPRFAELDALIAAERPALPRRRVKRTNYGEAKHKRLDAHAERMRKRSAQERREAAVASGKARAGTTRVRLVCSLPGWDDERLAADIVRRARGTR